MSRLASPTRWALSGLLLALLVLGACRREGAANDIESASSARPATAAATADEPAAVAPAQPTPAAAASPAFLAEFSEGMPYARLREAVTGAGWVPLRNPMCRDNVGGEAGVCEALLEVESCSGDGACLMYFADPADGRRLRVTAYGPYERWNVPGEASAFAVRSWDLHPPEPAAATACPADDFAAFLQRFASDETVRRAYTAPVIEVGELYLDADGNDASRTVYVAAEAYRDFDIVHRDGAYHYQDVAEAVDPVALPLIIESPTPQQRLVRFAYGMSEGNAYRFERRAGCWVFTADPEPPSP